MLLRQETLIKARAADVFRWLEDMDRHYIEWHPDHVSCRYVRGSTFEPGAVLFCQEYLHGKPHKFMMRLTSVIPGRRVEFSLGPGMGGAFEVRPAGDGARLCAELRLGFQSAGIAALQDALLLKAMSWRIEALREHMAEEGESLRRILESGGLERARLVEGCRRTPKTPDMSEAV